MVAWTHSYSTVLLVTESGFRAMIATSIFSPRLSVVRFSLTQREILNVGVRESDGDCKTGGEVLESTLSQ